MKMNAIVFVNFSENWKLISSTALLSSEILNFVINSRKSLRKTLFRQSAANANQFLNITQFTVVVYSSEHVLIRTFDL